MVEIGTVGELNRFPMTGAQAEDMGTAPLSMAGILGDRTHVVYDCAVDPHQARNRISQKPHGRRLARLMAAHADALDALIVDDPDDNGGRTRRIPFRHDSQPDCYINEFEDLTPGIDMGDELAAWVAGVCGVATARLAQKTMSWLRGEGTPPSERKIAPLHFIFSRSWEAARQLLPAESDAGPERLRANGYLDVPAMKAFAENDLVGHRLIIADNVLRISRLCERCYVTGIDQRTAENKHDFPNIFKQLPHVGKETVFGVYAYPETLAAEGPCLEVGEAVFLD